VYAGLRAKGLGVVSSARRTSLGMATWCTMKREFVDILSLL
jgi:hypothetical protein